MVICAHDQFLNGKPTLASVEMNVPVALQYMHAL